jgi:hypothetical protein
VCSFPSRPFGHVANFSGHGLVISKKVRMKRSPDDNMNLQKVDEKLFPTSQGSFDLSRIFPRLSRALKCSELAPDTPREMTVEAGGGNQQLTADGSYTFAFLLGLSGSHFIDPLSNPQPWL